MDNWSPTSTGRAVDVVQRRTDQDAASEEFPAIPLTTGHSLHVFPMRGCWQVWLNTQPSDFNGLRVAMGRTYEDAVNAALQVFARASDTLLSGPERRL